ncbi:DsrE/DsrF/DrsH-like family protein [Methanolobus bombayensis]|uniref:DsrE/DsrF/DrsH-like family protein n=1 Tax=Methanolobus bombayensis TaxID=38023 RepID=UPI001AE854AC|nr:DsrE/DsrF/DrsH-like family protein [Methanolobus bombayensis]MBP1908302.1 putative peroxiredoxin [Methanolobus bombayensis]
MTEVTKALLLLKDMVYESTSPMEILRFSNYYCNKGLDVMVIIFGPMGVILGKADKCGSPAYDEKIKECMELSIQFRCCKLGASIIGMKEEELIPGIEFIESHEIAEMLLEYCREGQLVVTL